MMGRHAGSGRLARALWDRLRKRGKITLRFYPVRMSPKKSEEWWRQNQSNIPDQVRQIAVVMDVYTQRVRRGLVVEGRRGRPTKFSDLDLQLLAFVLSILDNATGREAKSGHQFSSTETLILVRSVLEIVEHPHCNAGRALNSAISRARELSPISIFG